MKIQKIIPVYLVNKRFTKPIDVTQYDTGVQLVFESMDYDIPSSTSAIMYVQKPSGKFVYQTTKITVSGNTVTIDLENQALTESGKVGYQVSLVNGSDTITTFTGLMEVDKSLKDSGATESKTVVSAFDNLTAEEIAKITSATNAQISRVQAESALQQLAVEDKGKKVLDTIPDEYVELDSRVESVRDGLRTKADAIVQTVQGTEILVSDSSDDWIRNLKMFGKTEQDKTNGYQLFDISRFPDFTAGGTTVANNADGTKTVSNGGVSMLVKPDGTMKISGSGSITSLFSARLDYTHEETVKLLKAGKLHCNFGAVSVPRLFIQINNESGTLASMNNEFSSTASVDITQEMLNDENVYLRCSFYQVNGTVVPNTIKPMLYQDGNGTWEKFTNKTVAPNPQYPQPLESNGKWGNLLPYPYQFTDYNNAGIVAKVNNDCGITFSGTSTSLAFMVLGDLSVKAGETYKFSGTVEGKIGYQVWEYNNDTYGTELIPSTTNNNFTYTFNKDMTIRVRIIVISGRTVSETVYPQITYAEDNITEYRPYSGQKEVESFVYGKNWLNVDGTEFGRDKWFMSSDNGLKISSFTNENLFTFTSEKGFLNITNYNTTGWKWLSRFVELKPNTDYTVSGNKGFGGIIVVGLNDNNVGAVGVKLSHSETFNSGNYKYYMVSFYNTGSGYPMIRLAEVTDESFAPYTKQSHISLVGDGLKGIPLGQTIPDVIANSHIHMSGVYWDVETEQYYISDTVNNESGELVQRIASVTLDSNFHFIKNDNNSENYLYYTWLYEDRLITEFGFKYVMCNKLVTRDNVNVINENGAFERNMGIATSSNKAVYINVGYLMQENTEAELLRFLNEHKPTLYYILETPIITPLSADEIASYKALKSNYKVTSVMNDCGAFTEFSYNADTKLYIDNKFAELAKQMI